MAVDFLKEAAVLVAVFLPLDRIVSKEAPFTQRWVWVYTRLECRSFRWSGLVEKLRKV